MQCLYLRIQCHHTDRQLFKCTHLTSPKGGMWQTTKGSKSRTHFCFTFTVKVIFKTTAHMFLVNLPPGNCYQRNCPCQIITESFQCLYHLLLAEIPPAPCTAMSAWLCEVIYMASETKAVLVQTPSLLITSDNADLEKASLCAGPLW